MTLTKEALQLWGKRFFQKLWPYRYPALVLLLGLALLTVPGQEKTEANPVVSEQKTVASDTLEKQLEEVLCQIEGAGSVRVILSVDTGEEQVFQTDRQTSSREGETEIREETVLVSQDGEESPAIIKTVYPRYKGAVVVCLGADSAAVRLHIVQAVSSLTGLGSDKITVLKMKG